MVKITTRLCFLHYQDDEIVLATHRYYAKTAKEWYDVCDDHTKEVNKLGLEVEKIYDNPEES